MCNKALDSKRALRKQSGGLFLARGSPGPNPSAIKMDLFAANPSAEDLYQTKALTTVSAFCFKMVSALKSYRRALRRHKCPLVRS